MKSGIEIITDERKRQLEVEGWTPEHDAKHTDGELAEAASVYAGFATSIIVPVDNVFSNDRNVHKVAEALKGTDACMLIPKTHRWPFDKEWYKPTPDNRIKELAKAGALIAAEIDRIQAIPQEEQLCYKTNEPCIHNCHGQCKESC